MFMRWDNVYETQKGLVTDKTNIERGLDMIKHYQSGTPDMGCYQISLIFRLLLNKPVMRE